MARARIGVGGKLMQTTASSRSPAVRQPRQRHARASQQHALPHEILDAPEIMRRFPFRIRPTTSACFSATAASLAAESSVEALVALARRRTRRSTPDMRVLSVEPRGQGVLTAQPGRALGPHRYRRRRPWLGDLCPGLRSGSGSRAKSWLGSSRAMLRRSPPAAFGVHPWRAVTACTRLPGLAPRGWSRSPSTITRDERPCLRTPCGDRWARPTRH